MTSIIISILGGLIFSLGLTVSGMIDPAKVRGFLDIFGNWDYSLIFVMGGAVVFNFISFKIVTKRKPFCADAHFLPTKKEIDWKLVGGAALFGIGWGLLGICPGPGLVNLVKANSTLLIFLASLLAGMGVHKVWDGMQKS